ncbi:hypothetical protein GCM10010441_38360 [Kitasatospora paracochleata]|uniref:Uncharacterized protein n=1 Tax=Kitasatospora paracochleata TaxID=58354 RepID=A0ABT1IP62_9ACTN|nr:hypothetical protein [Kitasatospora paracochleata]MCP2306918.1 hypothetical protein [Kitasatospora paracochleata]
MSTGTAAEQINAARAMVTMALAFSHFPAPELRLDRLPQTRDGSEYVWGVSVSLHDSLSHFEQWREALGLDPADVEAHLKGSTHWLNILGTWGGIRVRLTGFFTFHDPAPAR